MRLITKIRLLISAAAAPFLVVLYLNIEKWAEARGYDLLLTKVAEGKMPDALAKFSFDPSVLFMAVVFCSLVAGIWLDALLRRLLDKVTFIQPNIITYLQMQFKSGSSNAIQLGNKNIENAHFERQAFRFFDVNAQLVDERVLWVGVLIFRKPTNYGQIIVDAGNAPIPGWTVISQKHNMAIVRFEGDIGNVALTIKTIPPNQV